MKIQKPINLRCIAFVGMAALSMTLFPQPISAAGAIRTWTGASGTDFNWSNPANWNGNTTAPVAGDYLVFDGTVGLNNTNDLTAATSFTSITFPATAGAFVLNGNLVKIGANGLGAGTGNGTGGVTNLSSILQTFNLQAEDDRTVHYTLTGDVINNNKLWDWRWYKHGPGTLIIAATNTASGLNGQALGIDGGLVIFNAQPNAGVIGQGLEIDRGGAVRIVGPSTNQISDSQDIFMTGGTFQLQTTNALGLPADEGIATLKSTNNAPAIVQNGSTLGPIGLIIGAGNNDYRGSFGGTILDGGAGALQLQVRRRAFQLLTGTNSYSGSTIITNYTGAGYTRLIVDGVHTGGGDYSVAGTAAGNYAALCGKGIISVSVVNISTNGVLSPGGTLSGTPTVQNNQLATFTDGAAILTISNVVNLTDASSALEIDLTGTTPGTGYDQVAMAGSGTFSNNNANLVIRMGIGYTPNGGDQFTIVQVPGTSSANNIGQFTSLNGVATPLTQGATFSVAGNIFKISYRAEGSTFDAGAGNGNNIMIQALASSSANLTWRGNGTDNNWDVTTTANWWNGTSLVTFTNLDNVTFDDMGSNNIPLNLVGDLNPNKLNINAGKNYTLAGSGDLTGAMVITKTNTGRFIITTANNNLTGGTIINQGTIQLGDGVTDGTLSGTITTTINTNGVLEYKNLADQTISGISGAGVLVHSGSGTLTVTNIMSAFTGVVSNQAGTFQVGDGTTGGATAANVAAIIDVTSGATLHYNYTGSGDVTVLNSVRGSGSVLYDFSSGSARTINLGAVTNTSFTGTTTVNPFTRLNLTTASAQPAGPIVVSDGGAYASTPGATFTNQNSISIAGQGPASPVDTPRGKGALRLGNIWAGPVTLSANATIGGNGTGTIIGNISDGGNNYTLELLGGSIQIGPASGVNTYGQTSINEDYSGSFTSPLLTTVQARNSNPFGSGPVSMTGLCRLNLNGNNVSIINLIDGTLANSNGTSNAPVVANGSVTAAATLTLGSDNNPQTFTGTFINGSSQSLGLTKVGTGTFTVSGDSTNTGPVTVSAGTLALAAASGTYPNGYPVVGSGSFSNATVLAVADGATLDVSGRSGATLTLNANQTLKHSGAVTGAITITGNVNIGNGTLLLAINHAGLAHDSLAASGSVTYSGTLAVTNIGAVLQTGDIFQLFPGATSGFSLVNLPTVDGVNNVQYTWNNTVASDGKITVASVSPLVNTNAPQVQVSVVGNTLKLGWPTNAGWTLLTNSVSLSLANQWFPYPNSANLTNVDITMDPTKTNVFFKMVYPYP